MITFIWKMVTWNYRSAISPHFAYFLVFN